MPIFNRWAYQLSAVDSIDRLDGRDTGRTASTRDPEQEGGEIGGQEAGALGSSKEVQLTGKDGAETEQKLKFL